MNFSLAPFPGEEAVPGLRIAGRISREAGLLPLEIIIDGKMSSLAIPSPAPSPERRQRLWEDTCLEVFLARPGSSRYFEINLSPSGHWNVYRFDSYREGMREEERIASLPFRVAGDNGTLRLSLEPDIGSLLPPGGEIEAGVCAVIRSSAGIASHWALAHAGPRPDFHRRDGFLLKIGSGPETALPGRSSKLR